MKQVCLLCERTSQDTNLWCQETYCPAELSPTILDYGEFLGDIEIVKPIIILRAAVLYEAVHHEQKVFLKVAHPGEYNKEKLKREAEFLVQTNKDRGGHPAIPTIVPSHINTDVTEFSYGKAMIRGKLLYYYMLEYVANAEPLRDLLLKNPQPWFKHIGWIMISLSSALSYMHKKQRLHNCLSPESLLVRFDRDNVPRIILHDFGVMSDPQNLSLNWNPMFVPPAYTAPEMINNRSIPANPNIDVYGLGMIMYEMLVGEPPVTFKLMSDIDVYKNVLKRKVAEMDRADLVSVPEIAINAVNHQPGMRTPNVTTFYQYLRGVFEDVPKERTSRWPSQRTIGVVIAATLAIAFLIALAVSLNEFVL